MAPKIHDDCIQEKRIERLEAKSDRLDTKIDRIMDILADNKAQLSKILTRLDKKREDDKERNKAIQDEDERMDRIEQEQASQHSQNKILIGIATTLLIGFLLFFIEFQYKTYFLHP